MNIFQINFITELVIIFLIIKFIILIFFRKIIYNKLINTVTIKKLYNKNNNIIKKFISINLDFNYFRIFGFGNIIDHSINNISSITLKN